MRAIRSSLTIALAVAAASIAMAHGGVQNPAVKARMDLMTAIGDQTKILGQMAKGQRGFDAKEAQTAAAAIGADAAQIPDMFRNAETDPKSEALPAIWENYTDFTQKAMALQSAAEAATNIGDAAMLGAALSEIGAACKACHKDYRK